MTIRRLSLALAVMLWVSLLPRAGVVVVDPGPPASTLITGTITDASDPISLDPLGPVTPGTLEGDGGPPDVAFKTGTAFPVVVWATAGAVNDDIVFAEWTASGWTPEEFLTGSPIEEADPRVFVEADGTVHVVWWRLVAPHEVYWTKRLPEMSSWSMPVKVSGATESARRPSVVVFNKKLMIAYERDSTQPQMIQDVVVVRQVPGGSFTPHVLHSTERGERLDVMLHTRDGQLWADWKNGDEEFGCSEFDGNGWSSTDYAPWEDPTWVGVEAVRKQIMQQVVQ